MRYRYQKPHELLSEYVRTVLIAEGFAKSTENKVPLFTNGMSALLCRTEKSQAGVENILQLTLFGKSTSPEDWNLEKNETVVTYFFKPFALASLFNLDAASLTRRPIELTEWNAHKTNALNTQLIYAKTPDDKIEVLDNLLLHQMEMQRRECEIIRSTTDQMMNDSGPDILTNILRDLNLNERTFQRIFRKYVGVTPNQYRRICQFQISFEQMRKGQYDRLTDVAYNTGFADQSHFIRSFKEFTKITPKDYKKSGLKGKKL